MSSSRQRGLSFHEEFEEKSDGNYSDESGPPLPVKYVEEESSREQEISESEQEDETFSRGRSRSRSVHSHDDSSNIVTIVDPSSYVNKDRSSDADSRVEKAERSGPLLPREVTALKKGLEESYHVKNKEQIKEEKEERIAAVAEKHNRMSSCTIATNKDPNNNDIAKLRIKILMLGDSGVGKSSLICRWTMNTFSPTLVGTVGVDFKAKKVQIDSEPYQVQVWDTAGQEHFHKITTSYYRGSNGIMLVFDVSDRRSVENVEYWIKNIKKHAQHSIHVALIGNKTDLRVASNPNCCSADAGREIATKFGVPYFETSAKDSLNVDDAYMSVARSIINGGGNGVGGDMGASTGGSKNALGIKSQSSATSKGDGKGLFSGVGLGGIKKSLSLGGNNTNSSIRSIFHVPGSNGGTSSSASTSSSAAEDRSNGASPMGSDGKTIGVGLSEEEKKDCIVS